MAKHAFWYGLVTLIVVFTVCALTCTLNHHIRALIAMITVYTLLHDFLTRIRDHLQLTHQLQKAKAFAEALYPNNGDIGILLFEIRRYAGLQVERVDWFAGVGSSRADEGHAILDQTTTPALTKDQALDGLHKMLAKELVKNIPDSPTLSETDA